MATELRIAVCEYFQREAAAAIRSKGFEGVVVRAFPALCGRPRLEWDTVARAISNGEGDGSRVDLIGGACLAGLGPPPEALKSCDVHKLDNCFGLLADGKMVDGYIRDGAHLVTPGWLANWGDRLQEWGFDRETGRGFFREFATRLVLLDTGVDARSAARLRELADFLHLPFEIVPVGLEFLRLSMAKIVLEWRLHEERGRSIAALADANRQSADYAMVFDLIGSLTEIATETVAIEKVLDVFDMLFAPARLAYLSLVDGEPAGMWYRPTFTAGVEAAASPRVGLRQEYAWTESGNGFLLRIDHQGETLGVLEVDGIAFPEHRQRYLNLAITVGRVCGLAISNARTYEKIKRTEEALAAERERLAVTLHSIGDGVIATDREGKVVLVNQVTERLTGWTAEEALGRPLPEVFHIVGERTREPCENPVERVLDTGLVMGLANDTALIARDGTERSIADSAAPIRDRDGNTVGVVLVFRDVTESKRIEEAQRFLGEASAILGSSLDHETTLRSVARLAVPCLADLCIVGLVEENQSMHLLEVAHVDPRKERLAREMQLRYPPDPTRPGSYSAVLSTGRPYLVSELSDSMLEASSRDADHLEMLRELRPGSYMIVPLVARQRTLGILAFATSESGRRYGAIDLALAEELARRAALAMDNSLLYQQAREALRGRDELFSAVSHDLKNPLTAIKGTAQLLRRRAARMDLGEFDGLPAGLASIDATATKMSALIDEMLDLARIQTGRPLDLRRRPTDLVKLAGRVADEHQQGTDRHSIRFEAAVPELLGVWDPARLERVLANLLSNAVKYSPEGGEIVVVVAREETEDDRRAVLVVRDQGIGIPAEDLPRIFERYHRAGNVAGRIAGTGIGLASARQIVEQHGGSITAASEEGSGSTFTVRLPLGPPHGDPRSGPPR